MVIPDSGLLPAILAPARLLVREVGQWLPLVGVLAMMSVVPTSLVRFFLPDAFSLLVGGAFDADALLVGLGMISLLLGMRLLIELTTYMLAFVLLADLTAGRPRDVLGGLRRLASWRLQGAWLVAGFVEQAAIGLWFLGAGVLLVPFGLATTAAYEEGTGFGAFHRSLQLGALQTGPRPSDRPGRRLAIAVTLSFFVGFLVNVTMFAVWFAVTFGSTGPALLAQLASGQLPPELGALMPAYGTSDVVIALLLAPLGLLPTIYMMTAQQMFYHHARRHDEAHPAGLDAPTERHGARGVPIGARSGHG